MAVPTLARAVRPVAAGKVDALSEAVAALNPDEMTPREALEALYRLKGMAGE